MNKSDPFKYFHSSLDVIRLAVLLDDRCSLSHRNVEDSLCGAASILAKKRSGTGGTVLTDVRSKDPQREIRECNLG